MMVYDAYFWQEKAPVSETYQHLSEKSYRGCMENASNDHDFLMVVAGDNQSRIEQVNTKFTADMDACDKQYN